MTPNSTSPRLVEVGRLWLHLYTGAASVDGFARLPEGGPEVGGTMRRDRPVGEGGTERLFEGLDPTRRSTTTGPIYDMRTEPAGFDSHGFDWAGRCTSDVQAEAERRGWRVVTRAEAGQRLLELGYRLRPRHDGDGRRHFHDVLWLDQLDGLTWHVRESVDGFRHTSQRCAFVVREVANQQWGGPAATRNAPRPVLPR